MPSALVTGATGLVGSHIVERLVTDGWSVRALVRRHDDWLAALGVQLALGDILDLESFATAAIGCDVIFHTAAAVIVDGGWEAFRRLNVDGTRNAIVAAERAGARLLQLSSVAVYSGRYDDPSQKTDEDTQIRPLPERAFYPRSKRESELLVMDAHAAGRIWATAVRPCVVYGRRDRHFVPRVAKALRFGIAPLIGGGRSTLAIVHAANVADGAVLAATSDRAGGRAYNLANDFEVTVRDFLQLAGEGLGKQVRFVNVPPRVAQAVYRVGFGVLRLVAGSQVSLASSDSLSMITRDNPFTSERARRELGWNPQIRPETGVPDSFRWWHEHQH